MTVEDICLKAGITQEQLADAIVYQSRKNQKIINASTKEAKLTTANMLAKLEALETENRQMRAMIDNYNISKEYAVVREKVIAEENEKQKQLDAVKSDKTEPPPVKPIKVIKS